jgi:hypothetical protein
MDHEFQFGLTIFDGVWEDKHPPSRVNATNIVTRVNTWSQWITNGGQLAKDDLAKFIGMTHLSILFRLYYWKVQHINMGTPLVSY